MSKYLGDFTANDVIDFKFTTYRPSTGASFTLAGSPVISVYKDNDLTQSITGVALTIDFDGVTGLNHVRITTSADATFYANGGEFECVITTGTVDSVSVVGSCVGRFTLGRTAANVYNALLTSYTTAGTFGGNIVRTKSTSPSNEVFITGANHIAADVHALQAGVIFNTTFASNAVDATVLSADAANEIADALLNRNVAGGSSTGRLVKEALYALRNKTSISSTTLQVWNNDDSAIVWSASLSSDAAAIPITGIDPA